MFFEFLNEILGIGIYEKIVALDFIKVMDDDFLFKMNEDFGYEIIYYDDVEKFRYLYESEIKKEQGKYLAFLREDLYLPYDIRKDFHLVDISYKELFPRLNAYALENSHIADLDLLYIAHENLYTTLNMEFETKNFLQGNMFDVENLKEYREYLIEKIHALFEADDYKSWSAIALMYSKLEYIKYKCNFKEDTEDLDYMIQTRFKEFILNKYSELSSYSLYSGPVLLNRGLDYIFMNSKKPALIVMDGMSIVDWLIISETLEGISYKYNYTYAIIPTITSISRQCLLSGKLPVELENPFSLAHERKLFFKKSMKNGYKEQEIKYNRGYDFEIDYMDKCICIIINDIDDLIHSQKQGNMSMYNDVRLLASSGKLNEMIKRLYNRGFDIYITSDHGHKETETIGNPKGMGVEVETKSKRTLVLKEFADYEGIMDEFDMIEYPGYFLNKDFKYLLCEHDKSFGLKGNIVLSHGGISIEEVIVPFIKVEGVDYE